MLASTRRIEYRDEVHFVDHIVAVINDLAEACSGSAAGLVVTSVFADNSAGIGTPHACRN